VRPRRCYCRTDTRESNGPRSKRTARNGAGQRIIRKPDGRASVSADGNRPGPVAERYWSGGTRPRQWRDGARRRTRPASSSVTPIPSAFRRTRRHARYHWHAGAHHFSMRRQTDFRSSDSGRPAGVGLRLNTISSKFEWEPDSETRQSEGRWS